MDRGRELKPHIGIYGRRNNGKSSFINVITGQNTAIVSDFAGTTTDPVKKSYEITSFGPVVLIDTAGIDDVGELGNLRINKTLETIKLVDLGIIIIAQNTFGEYEQQIINELNNYNTPFIIVHNKNDIEPLGNDLKQELQHKYNVSIVDFSTITKNNFEGLIQNIKNSIPESSYKMPTLVGDLINYGDIVLLIVPIDIEAPAGRLILPQIQTIRDILDNDSVAIVVKEREVDAFLRKTGIKPNLAITDSSIFLKADASVPREIPLTGFSVVLARLKGDFAKYLEGTPQIDNLKDGDTVLMLESCTHHVSCEDIGRTKIPRWLSNYTGKNLKFEVVSGLDQVKDIAKYAMIIQCGGCMITPKQLKNRLRPAINAGIPVSNYGMTIAYLQGIFSRAIEPFVKKTKTDYL